MVAPDILSELELLDDDPIESRVGVHDSNHVELKLDYAMRGARRARYQVETYFFVPRSLGINEHTYRAEQFYGDLQAYVRFKTPPSSLARLADPSKDDTSLALIRRLLEKIRQGSRRTEVRQELTRELRLFGCLVRGKVRDRVKALRPQIDGLKEGRGRVEDIGTVGMRLFGDIESVLSTWRGLRPSFLELHFSDALVETYDYVDEYLSLVIEEKLASVVRVVDELTDELRAEKKLQLMRNSAIAIIKGERGHRTEQGYRTVIEGADDADDHFVYRQGMLKKFVMSVLWLEITKEKEGKKAANFGAAIAAGVAMFFTLVAALLGSRYYALNSWPFVVVGVLTYILKDRIKEWLKVVWGHSMSRFLADYNLRLRDPVSGKVLGRCRERFRYLASDQVPELVKRARWANLKTSVEPLAKPEVVLRYMKEVEFRSAGGIGPRDAGDGDINDIIRFSLWEFLNRADDPEASIPYYDEDRDRVKRKKFQKLYHLNIVMVFRATGDDRSESVKRVRVVFDKRGIRKLAEVS